MFALDGPVPPGVDVGVDLLVQLAHGAGADPCAPQRLRDVLHPTDRHARQVHLDHRLLDARFPSLVTLDDLGLEGQAPQSRHLQHHLAGLRCQFSIVVSGSGVQPLGASLVSLRPAKFVGLGLQQSVQSLLNRTSHHLLDVLTHLTFVNPDNLRELHAIVQIAYNRHGSSLFLVLVNRPQITLTSSRAALQSAQ